MSIKASPITGIFVSLAMTATAPSAEEDPKFTDSPSDNTIREITTSNAEIQAACPQLQAIQLEEIPFNRIPMTDRIHDIYFSDYIPLLQNQDTERREEIDRFRFSLKQAGKYDVFFAHINSLGGSLDTGQPIAYDIYNTNGTVITYASDYAASMAFSLLISGTNGDRYVDANSYLMVHEAKITGEKGAVLSENNATDPTIKSSLASSNEHLREYITINSVTEITAECTATLVQPNTDVQIMPKDAVKLGLVDYSIDWINRKATVRSPQP